MKITVFKRPGEQHARDYDLENCTAGGLENALYTHCKTVGVDPAEAAVFLCQEERNGHEHIVKGTATEMTMREVAAELIGLYEQDCGKKNCRIMNVTGVKAGAFANGFDYFCINCGQFFSAQSTTMIHNVSPAVEIAFCPYCGEDLLYSTIDGIQEHCFEHGTDTVNFYHAFPLDDPIPGSSTGATPRQVEAIITSVINRKKEKRLVTIGNTALSLDYPERVVEAVFDELHITQGNVA